ncbi:MAG: 3-deoxy-7-phosphoheptulonate synthase, partial [Eubacterium sp.]|nr:3-deoxy-7-phosphoheptulonate synthase [Eubacterium sp.]
MEAGMIIVLKENTTGDQKNQLVQWFEGQGLKVHESDGEYKTIL